MISQISDSFQSDRYAKKLGTYKHLVITLYGIFSDSYSLRELVLGCLINGRWLLLGRQNNCAATSQALSQEFPTFPFKTSKITR
jgi:hypothetical protein